MRAEAGELAGGRAGTPAGGFWRIHNYVLTLLVCTLSVTVMLKLGQIQYLELVLVADLLVLAVAFAARDFQVRVYRPFFSLGKSYAVFLLVALGLALVALRQDFFPFDNNPLKQPLAITVSRMVELVLDVFYMLYLASLFRTDARLCRFGANVYYWTGIAGGLYSLATLPLNVALSVNLGTYGPTHRMRGFNNEGGPYGVYVITVLVLMLAMYRMGWMGRARLWLGMMVMLVCLAGSQSKAAFLALAVMGMLYLVVALKGWKRWMLIAGTGGAFALLAVAVNLPAQIAIYEQASAMYQNVSNVRAGDANTVMGRVAGAVLAPRMIAAHPLLGIGWGNYPLVRDDPQYRRGTAFTLSNLDSPSLGPIDYIVELGFPLWIYMTWLSFKPAFLLRRVGVNPWLFCLAAMQPVSNWFGTHLNIIYPWVCVGLALGMGLYRRGEDAEASSVRG